MARKEVVLRRAVEQGRSLKDAALTIRTTRNRMMAARNNTNNYSQRDTAKKFKDFFDNLYADQGPIPQSEVRNFEGLPRFEPDEVIHAITQLRRSGASGSDGISPSMLFHAREEAGIVISNILNHLVDGGAVPKKLTEAIVTLLHKSGDSDDPANFRPICLLQSCAKVLSRVLMRRMERCLADQEDEWQTGFRKGYSTIDNLHSVKQIIEKSTEHNLKLCLGFIDSKKAFDTISWQSTWNALTEMGVHSTLILLLRRLYESGSTFILINGNRVPVDVKRGMRQGDVLSPKLFNATLSHAINKIDWDVEGIRINGQQLATLGYADDLVLFSRSRPGMERMMCKLTNVMRTVGLEINTKKTVLMSNIQNKAPLMVNGSSLNFVDKFIFLGSQISIPLSDYDEIRRRMGQAFGAFNKVTSLLTCRLLPMAKRRQLFESYVTPVALYGAESWSLREAEKNYIEVCQRRMERRMIEITTLDRWTNQRIRERTKLTDWRKKALAMKLRWAEKTIKMEPNRWTKITTEWIPFESRRQRGRQRLRWVDEVQQTIGHTWCLV